MINSDKNIIKASKRYAKALFQSALEAGMEEKVYGDIIFLDETINSNPDFKTILLNPSVQPDVKKDIVQKVFSPHIEKISLEFLLLLIDAGRINCLNKIADYYNFCSNTKNNIINPVIISAAELNDMQKDRLIQKLAEKTGKNIVPEYIVDADIIGGLIIKISDKTIDCSIKAKFDNVKKQLTKGNSYGKN